MTFIDVPTPYYNIMLTKIAKFTCFIYILFTKCFYFNKFYNSLQFPEPRRFIDLHLYSVYYSFTFQCHNFAVHETLNNSTSQTRLSKIKGFIMNTLNINTNNETLANMSDNINKAKDIRANTVQSIIRDTLDYANDHKEVFSTKKNAIATFIKLHLSSDVDNYTKRALKVAKFILVDGYKVKRELLSIAQMEQLLTFNKNTVNALMSYDEDEYINEVKELIKSAKIEKTTNVFSAKKAKGL